MRNNPTPIILKHAQALAKKALAEGNDPLWHEAHMMVKDDAIDTAFEEAKKHGVIFH